MPGGRVYPNGDFTNEPVIGLEEMQLRLLAREPLAGFFVYDNGQETLLECWDCSEPLLVHIEKIEGGKVFFHVVTSDVLRSLPTSWLKGMMNFQVEQGGMYACITPPWVAEYDSRDWLR